MPRRNEDQAKTTSVEREAFPLCLSDRQNIETRYERERLEARFKHSEGADAEDCGDHGEDVTSAYTHPHAHIRTRRYMSLHTCKHAYTLYIEFYWS